MYLLIIICFSLSPVTFAKNHYSDREALSGSDNDGTGIVEVYKKLDGRHIESLDIILSIKGWWINKYIVSSGNKIYFLACKKKNDKKSNFRLYEYDRKSKKYKLLFKMPSRYTDGFLTEAYGNSVYMLLSVKEKDFCLRYYIKSGKLKTILNSKGYFKYKDYLVLEKEKDVKKVDSIYGFTKNKSEIIVYNTRTGKKKKIFDGHAEGLCRKGRYLYYAVSTDGKWDTINIKTKYKIIRYDLATGKKKTILKSGDFLEIELVTDRYVYHNTWTFLDPEYFRYDLKKKKTKKMSEDAFYDAYSAFSDLPGVEADFIKLG